MSGLACHQDWPKETVCLPGSNDSFSVTELYRQDYRNARSVCLPPAKRACHPCPTTGFELQSAVGLSCSIREIGLWICSGSTEISRQDGSLDEKNVGRFQNPEASRSLHASDALI